MKSILEKIPWNNKKFFVLEKNQRCREQRGQGFEFGLNEWNIV